MRLIERKPFWYVEFRDSRGAVQRRSTRVALSKSTVREATERANQIIRDHDAALAREASTPIQDAIVLFLDCHEGYNLEVASRAANEEDGPMDPIFDGYSIVRPLRASTLKLYGTLLEHFRSHFHAQGWLTLTDVTKETVEHFRDARKTAVKQAPVRRNGRPVLVEGKAKMRTVRQTRSVRNELVAVSALCAFCYVNRALMPGAPSDTLMRSISTKGLAKAAVKVRSIDIGGLERVLEEAGRHPDPFWGRFVPLLADTGMRRDELLGMTWERVLIDHVATTAEFVLGSEVKTGKGRIVPLGDEAYRILLGVPRAVARRPGEPEFLFVNPETRTRYVTIYRAWHGIRERAGFPELRLHDLRHTYASLTKDSGLSEEDRMAVVGHSAVEVHRHYARGGRRRLASEVIRHSPLSEIRKRKAEKNADEEG